MNEFGAEFSVSSGLWSGARQHTTANAIARLNKNDARPRLCKPSRGREAGGASADDDRVRVVAPSTKPYFLNCLMTSRCLSGGLPAIGRHLRLEHHKPLARAKSHGLRPASCVQL